MPHQIPKIKPRKYKIATAIQRFLPQLEQQGQLSGHQRSVLKLMSICKTAALGSHKERCDQCAHSRVHYNSCRNRNCPNCQGVNKEKWILDRQHDLLPVKYFHCVFTIPRELRSYFRYNKKLLYDLLMTCVKDILFTLGYDPKQGIGGKIGAIMILHTWTQQMTYHPHIHCIVPAGGLKGNGQWKQAKSKGEFLFPVRAMSVLLRGKLLDGIHELYKSGQLNLTPELKKQYRPIKNKLYQIGWNVYAKKAFGGPDQVLEYIGRYTHKICISNHRIIDISDTHVTFRYTNRKIKKSKTKTITGTKFIKLFAEHILPKGMVKIRHIGILSSRTKQQDLAIIRKSLNAPTPPPKVKMTTRELIKLTTGKDPNLCPCCQKGEMVIVSVMPAIRGSPIKTPIRFAPKGRKIQLSHS